MKFLGISYNISELIGKIIFPQLIISLAIVTLYHSHLLLIPRWLPLYHKFLNFGCRYFDNQKKYFEQTVRAIFSVLSDFSSDFNMFFE